MTQLINRQGFAPQTMTEAMEFSKMLADSTMVPRQYQGKPQDIMVCVQWGYEIGLAPMQALQNIAVINGKPSVYGDAAMALVQSSSVCEDVQEYFDGEGTPNPVAVCVAQRKGRKPVVAKFSVEDAKRAGLWGKQGPWSAYPKRMLQMRARGFALRDAFPDVLKGLITAEEAQDYPAEQPVKDITPPVNPLDVIAAPVIEAPVEALPEPVDNSVDNLDDVNAAVREVVEEEAVVYEPAADEIELKKIEDKEFWPLEIPGKEAQVYHSYEDWAKAYDELCDKVASHGKMGAQTKLEKLKALHDINKYCMEKMNVNDKLKHIAAASVRRDKVLGGDHARP